MGSNKIKFPKKGAVRKLAAKLKKLSKQSPPKSLVDKINKQVSLTKEQEAQSWVYTNIDSTPDRPSFEEVWLAGYSKGEGDAITRSMQFIERQGVEIANLQHELLLAVKTNKECVDKILQQAKEIERLCSKHRLK